MTNFGWSRLICWTAREKTLSRCPPVRSETTANWNWSGSLLSLSEVQGFLSPDSMTMPLGSAADRLPAVVSERDRAIDAGQCAGRGDSENELFHGSNSGRSEGVPDRLPDRARRGCEKNLSRTG